ncbi:hypothetical protein EON63_12955 [archaeon]|nr:MAG: hypothetical protein EON63_12955 [archaeon]
MLLDSIDTSLLPQFIHSHTHTHTRSVQTEPNTNTSLLTHIVQFELHRAMALFLYSERKYSFCLEHIHIAMNVFEKLHTVIHQEQSVQPQTPDHLQHSSLNDVHTLSMSPDLLIPSLVDVYVLLVCTYTAINRLACELYVYICLCMCY